MFVRSGKPPGETTMCYDAQHDEEEPGLLELVIDLEANRALRLLCARAAKDGLSPLKSTFMSALASRRATEPPEGPDSDR
jgi:hypothetical protein